MTTIVFNYPDEQINKILLENSDLLTIIFITTKRINHYSNADFRRFVDKIRDTNKNIYVINFKIEGMRLDNIDKEAANIKYMNNIVHELNNITSSNKIIIVDVDLYINFYTSNNSRIWNKIKDNKPVNYFKHSPDMDPKVILNIFDNLEGHVYPTPDLQYIVGTKQYYKLPEIKELLYPFSGVYPDDKTQIVNLPENDYVLKFGLSSGSDGVYLYNKTTGKEIVNIIEKHTSFPSNEMVLVQSYNPDFIRCCEYKFFVVDGQINAVFCQHLTSEISQSFLHTSFLNRKTGEKFLIDPKVYKLIKKVWQIFSNKSPVMYLRIDIILDTEVCSTYHDLIDSEHNYNVYLNEVETLASGLKMYSHLEIEDTGQEAYILNKNNFEPIIYGKIIDNLLARY